jgi:hypothetical protein
MSWITPQVQEIIHSQPPWPGFVFKVRHASDGVFLLISSEELGKFSKPKQDDLIAWILTMMNDIRKLHVPCYIQEWKKDSR